jgi:hypothetical protein
MLWLGGRDGRVGAFMQGGTARANARRHGFAVGYIMLIRAHAGERVYTVLIDGATSGRITRGRTLSLDVPAGQHTLQLKTDEVRSEPEEVTVVAGRASRYGCAPGGDPDRGRTIALWQINDPSQFPDTEPKGNPRIRPAYGFGYTVGLLLLAAGWLLHVAGAGSKISNVVLGVGLSVTIVSAIASTLDRRNRNR